MVGALPRALASGRFSGPDYPGIQGCQAADMQETTSARAKPRKVNVLPKTPYAKQYFIAKPNRFFGFTIVWDYLATVNSLLVTLKTHPGCGMYGGYACEWTCVHIHRHVDVCAYRVEVYTYIHMHVGSPTVMHVSVHASTHVDMAIQTIVLAWGRG